MAEEDEGYSSGLLLKLQTWVKKIMRPEQNKNIVGLLISFVIIATINYLVSSSNEQILIDGYGLMVSFICFTIGGQQLYLALKLVDNEKKRYRTMGLVQVVLGLSLAFVVGSSMFDKYQDLKYGDPALNKDTMIVTILTETPEGSTWYDPIRLFEFDIEDKGNSKDSKFDYNHIKKLAINVILMSITLLVFLVFKTIRKEPGVEKWYLPSIFATVALLLLLERIPNIVAYYLHNIGMLAIAFKVLWEMKDDIVKNKTDEDQWSLSYTLIAITILPIAQQLHKLQWTTIVVFFLCSLSLVVIIAIKQKKFLEIFRYIGVNNGGKNTGYIMFVTIPLSLLMVTTVTPWLFEMLIPALYNQVLLFTLFCSMYAMGRYKGEQAVDTKIE